jgi:hypothetical protein
VTLKGSIPACSVGRTQTSARGPIEPGVGPVFFIHANTNTETPYCWHSARERCRHSESKPADIALREKAAFTACREDGSVTGLYSWRRRISWMRLTLRSRLSFLKELIVPPPTTCSPRFVLRDSVWSSTPCALPNAQKPAGLGLPSVSNALHVDLAKTPQRMQSRSSLQTSPASANEKYKLTQRRSVL